MNIEQKRKLEGVIALSLSSLAAVIGLFWLVFILGDVLIHGIGALNIGLFFNDPVPAGMEGGGLRNAFIGQLLITVCATLIGVPIGVLGGTFLAEYARRTKFARVISVLADIIVSVPWTLREAAFALGAPYYKVIVQVVYRGAATGILTGVLLSIARVAGETAPLLFTSFNNNFFSTNMNGPIASLTVTIFQYAMGPYDSWHAQAWAASFVITLFILVLTLAGRLILKWRYK